MRKRPRRHVDLSDPRSVLATTGEIAIGAYAQQQRRRQIVLGIFGLALVGVAAWFVFAVRATHEADAPGRYVVAAECNRCGWQGDVPTTLKDQWPKRCPKCGEPTVQKRWICHQCQNTFLPRPVSGLVTCPKCGSTDVGAAVQTPEPNGK